MYSGLSHIHLLCSFTGAVAADADADAYPAADADANADADADADATFSLSLSLSFSLFSFNISSSAFHLASASGILCMTRASSGVRIVICNCFFGGFFVRESGNVKNKNHEEKKLRN